MPKTANELRAEKKKAIDTADAIHAAAEKESRDLTDAENGEFVAQVKRAKDLDGEISRADRSEALEDAKTELRRSQGRRVRTHGSDFDEDAGVQRGRALRNWFVGGTQHADFSYDAVQRAQQFGMNPSVKMIELKETVSRALVSNNTPGSKIVTPTMANSLVERIALESPLLSLVGRDVTTDGAPRRYTTADDTGNVAVIIDENTDLQSADPTFDNLAVPCFKYSSKLIKVSIELLQDANVNLEDYIFRSIAGRVRRGLEAHATTGTGTGQPKGLAAAAGVGVTTTSGAQVTAGPTYGNLVDMQQSVSEPFRSAATWVISDSLFGFIKKMVDGQGRPLWLPGIAGVAPPTILNRPYIISPYLDTWAGANKTVALYGDLSQYLLRQALGTTITRLDERFAEVGMVAWVGIARFGGNFLGFSESIKKWVIGA